MLMVAWPSLSSTAKSPATKAIRWRPSGYFAGDGSVASNSGRPGIVVSTVSLRLAIETAVLLRHRHARQRVRRRPPQKRP
ncbi:MAG: LAGLIDADG family homing endonuclease [Thermoplasmatota archaeon]